MLNSSNINVLLFEDEWTQLLQMLMYFDLDEIAEKLQNEINSFICSIQESKSEIWNRYAPSSLDELKVSDY